MCYFLCFPNRSWPSRPLRTLIPWSCSTRPVTRPPLTPMPLTPGWPALMLLCPIWTICRFLRAQRWRDLGNYYYGFFFKNKICVSFFLRIPRRGWKIGLSLSFWLFFFWNTWILCVCVSLCFKVIFPSKTTAIILRLFKKKPFAWKLLTEGETNWCVSMGIGELLSLSGRL